MSKRSLTVIDLTVQLDQVSTDDLPAEVVAALQSAACIISSGFDTLDGLNGRTLAWSASGYWDGVAQARRFMVESVGWKVDGGHFAWSEAKGLREVVAA